MSISLAVRNAVGWLMQEVGLPGLVQPFNHNDHSQGINVSLRTSPRYSILKVNGYELFFDRESGKFDGVGHFARECGEDSVEEKAVDREPNDIGAAPSA